MFLPFGTACILAAVAMYIFRDPIGRLADLLLKVFLAVAIGFFVLFVIYWIGSLDNAARYAFDIAGPQLSWYIFVVQDVLFKLRGILMRYAAAF
jgi:hypothetical protein